MARFLPRQDVPIAEQGGRTSNPFYVFLQEVEQALQSGALSSDGLQEQIAAIATALGSPDGTVANIPPPSDQTGQIQGLQSLRAFGQLPGLVRVTLANDLNLLPGSHFYGTTGDGEDRGWQALVEALAAPGDGLALTLDGLLYLGTLASEADLPAVGEAGTVYLIDGDAYTWDGAAWQNDGAPAGVPGYVPADDLAAVEGLTGAGFAARTAADTWATRTLADTATIEWANGDGVAGDPSPSLKALPDAGGGSIRKFDRDGFGRVSGTSAATTDDLTEGAENLYHTSERVDARIEAAKADPDGIASLVGGKLDAGQLPALAITETFVVNTEAAMLALTAQQGDVAVRTDLQTSFILTAEPASTLANWQELLTPTGGVSSFNGRTGSVVPATGDYTPAQVGADPAGSASTAQAYSVQRGNHTGTQLANTISNFAATVRATVLTGLSTATNAAISATDTVLSALGKLQAQVTALGSTVSGLITQTITSGDTTHAPSGDAVFDALAGKADDSAVMHLSAAVENVAGVKYFDAGLVVGAPLDFWAYLSANTNARGFWGSEGYFGTNGNFAMSFRSNGYRNNVGAWTSLGRGGNAGASGIDLRPNGTVWIGTNSTTPTGIDVTWRWIINDVGVIPLTDNAYDVGTAALRARVIYAGTGSINTSDAREKTAPRDLTADELVAAADLARLPSIFQWLHAIDEKGDAARLHCSPTVQSVIACMEKHGLDPFRYGFVCYDEWDEQPEIRDEESGQVTQEYRPAGNRYSLRPSELAHFVMRGLAWRQDQLEARLAALEP